MLAKSKLFVFQNHLYIIEIFFADNTRMMSAYYVLRFYSIVFNLLMSKNINYNCLLMYYSAFIFFVMKNPMNFSNIPFSLFIFVLGFNFLSDLPIGITLNEISEDIVD